MPRFEQLQLPHFSRDVLCVLCSSPDDDGVAGFPVLRADGSVEGYITRTDLLRQQHYYKSLHYHNKGFSDNLKDRQKVRPSVR